ncbi:TIGR03943 family putative permease subunit [Microbacterium sp. ZW T5_56]|uniref:TIGR03943 family putative permease subunit n=1 Tax=Microbacterium sp. ZW T5_56 TaxID=3378081 RepID=UPI003851D9CE
MLHAIDSRWLGVGLASLVCVITVGLAVTGRLAMYVNPDGAWFTVGMAVLGLLAAAGSFALPLGAEQEHGHDHGDGHDHAHEGDHTPDHHHAPAEPAPLTRAQLRAQSQPVAPAAPSATLRSVPASPNLRRRMSGVAAVTGGVLATAVMVPALLLPPAALSAQLAMERDLGAPPLFGGADVVALATTADAAKFGVGDWAAAFAATSNPAVLAGTPVNLVGFVAPAADGSDDIRLTRLVVTHCVIDAQPAAVTVSVQAATTTIDTDLSTGQWVKVTGTVEQSGNGVLLIQPTAVTPIDQPTDPYEY